MMKKRKKWLGLGAFVALLGLIVGVTTGVRFPLRTRRSGPNLRH